MSLTLQQQQNLLQQGWTQAEVNAAVASQNGTPAPTQTQSSSYTPPNNQTISSMISNLRSQMQNGQITPQQAMAQLTTAMPAPGSSSNAPAYNSAADMTTYKNALSSATSQLYQPLQIISGGRSGMLNTDGSVSLTGTQINNSTVNAAGATPAKTTYQGGSVVDYLTSQGQPSDYASRSQLASSLGIQNYSGTAAQNTQLLNTLQQQNGGGTNSTSGNTLPSYTVQANDKFNPYTGQPLTADQTVGSVIQNPSASSATGTSGTGISVPSTGNSNLDQIQKSITDLANGLITSGYTIPATLQITPALVSQFLQYAHQAVDPYTQQLLSSEITNVNADLSNQQTQFQNQQDQAVQQFGTQLASQDNAAGANGTAFSGQRQLTDNNLVNSTNRSLSSLMSNTAYNMGSTLRSGAANVGAANAGGFNLPTLAGGSVGLGGQLGSYNSTVTTGNNPSFNYNPSLYTVGAIPSAGTQNVNQLEQSYINQYGTLAGNNSNGSRNIGDLIGMMSGLPSGYSIPSNLT